MPAKRYVGLVTGKLKQIAGVVVSTGAPNDGDLLALDATGRIDVSALPSGVGPAVVTMLAFETVAAGNYVNVFLDATVSKCRLADASAAAAGKRAHGYVFAAHTAGTTATVYFGDVNTGLTGLTIGVEYFLSHSTPGGAVAAGGLTTTAGHIVQRLGVATSATSVLTEIQEPVELA